MSAHRPTRAEVASVACPACFAEPHKPCNGTGKVRKVLQRHHIERVQRYRDGLFGPQPPVLPVSSRTDPSTEERP